jgi:hypothetical protein
MSNLFEKRMQEISYKIKIIKKKIGFKIKISNFGYLYHFDLQLSLNPTKRSSTCRWLLVNFFEAFGYNLFFAADKFV